MKLQWRLFVHAKNKTKARRVVKRFKDRIGDNITVLEIEPYWKDKTHFRVEAETDIGEVNLPQALLKTLLLCNKVAHGWNVRGPHLYDNDLWDFETSVDGRSGPISTISIAGISNIYCFAHKVKA